MYTFIRGQVFSITATQVILEANGIGYAIFVPISTLGKVPEEGSDLLLHVSFIVREMSQTLYGFLDSNERDLFEKLMDVSGIGAKVALSIIGHLEGELLHHAIQSNDIPTICKVPGVGRKTAERLMIEMRGKLPPIPDALLQAGKSQTTPRDRNLRDAMSALINLGYNQAIAQKALKACLDETDEELELSALITQSLKYVQK